MLIDTHAHLNFNAYKDDLDEVIKRSLDNKVWMINVGSQYETSKKAVKIAEQYEKEVYAAVGLHPIHLSDGIFKTKIDQEEIEFQTREEDFDYQKYKELARSKKVVAIGEIGFDYWYKPKTKKKLEEFKQKQKEVFLQQLELARELGLPVIFHCRMAHDDLLETLNFQFSSFKFRGAIHCFTGNWQQAERYLEMGLYLGFNGIIFKLDLDEIIKKTPLEKILIETDCPYLTPPPMIDRNEPLYVKYIAEKVAKIKNLNYEKVSNITTENARKLFNI
ncbi:MAG: TatD family hydrolase [Candidatus Nealsonbacteria bacterium]|nr:TatD family hydrolase [Candidatus Nealsonbacteria bacterium]